MSQRRNSTVQVFTKAAALFVYCPQEFMNVIKRNVAELETAVEKAESDLGTFSSIKKALNAVPLPSLFAPVRPGLVPDQFIEYSFLFQ